MLVTTTEFASYAREEADRIGLEFTDGRSLTARLDNVGASEPLGRVGAVRAAHLCPECDAPMVLGHSRYGRWLHCPSYDGGCSGKRDLDRDGRRALELDISR